MSEGALLFDLDGTLVDTRQPSWELFEETNRLFGLGVASRDEFFRAFEGNFFESLDEMCRDKAHASEAKAHFLTLLRTRYNPTVIPGMADVVRSLAPSYTLAVLSTNTIETIRRTLVTAGIATCFSHVFAGDVEPSKAASVRRFLADGSYASLRECSPSYAECAPTRLEMDRVTLITDTVGDVVEAKRCGIAVVGVSWGMHDEDQLLAAGADRVALWPQELIAWFRPDPPEAAGPLAEPTWFVDGGTECSCETEHLVADAPAPESTPLAALSTAEARIRHHRQTARIEGRRSANTRALGPGVQGSQRPCDELRRALQQIVPQREVRPVTAPTVQSNPTDHAQSVQSKETGNRR